MFVFRLRGMLMALATGVVAALACGPSDMAPGAHRAIGHPRRIVSLGPSSTEIIASLGLVERMVARSRWDRWPDTVRVVPEIGDAIRPNLERIVAARPDVVVLYAGADNASAVQVLGRAGIPVISLRIDTIEEFLHAVDTLGAVLGRRERADSIRETLRSQLQAVQARRSGGAPVRVFMPVWDAPLMTVGAGSFLHELVAIAGGQNVYHDRAASSLTISMEDVIRRDPDVILAGPKKALEILRDPQWRALRAVRSGRVLSYDTTLVSQPSTRLGEAAASLAALLTAPVRR